MRTSDRKRIKAGLIFYTASMVFYAVFGTVYEFFSHGVYSPFMVFVFILPLVFGIIPYCFAAFLNASLPSHHITQLYGGGVTILTLGCIMRGVLDIYGTTNAKLILFTIIGGALVITSIIANIITTASKKSSRNNIKSH